MNRYLVTTDVHGCHDELLALLAKLNYDPASDFLINLGDIIHRGPNSKGCVDVLRANANVVIMGNHEEKELKIRKARNAGLKKEEFTFTWNDDHLAVDESLTELDVDWLSNLPYYYKLTIDGSEWVFCHAGLLSWRTVEETKKSIFTHLRYVTTAGKATRIEDTKDAKHWSTYWSGPYNVVYGHHVHNLQSPLVAQHANGTVTVGLDTGACFGGKLSALVLPSKEIVQVDSKEYRPL